MKYYFTFILFLLFTAGCKPKELSGTALENKLIETMDNHLKETLQPGVKYTIKDVAYYPEKEKKDYICEFHVDMHYANKDTSGTVSAIISNDFKNVERKQ
jgi:hypothetical protein